jgi:hypothetical protein
MTTFILIRDREGMPSDDEKYTEIGCFFFSEAVFPRKRSVAEPDSVSEDEKITGKEIVSEDDKVTYVNPASTFFVMQTQRKARRRKKY